MTPIAIILVTISAFVHAFWNLLGKRQNPSVAFFFIGSAFAAICFLPLLWLYRDTFTALPPRIWLWLALTSLFEVVYFVGLAGAYRNGDMSVAYPLVRSLPVILVAIVTAILGLGKSLNLAGVAGILAVVLGCLILPLRSLRQVQPGNYLTACCLLACVAALGTTGYTLVDNQALLDMRAAPGMGLSQIEIAFLYLAMQSITIAIAMGAYILISSTERAELYKIWRNGKSIALVTGLLIVGTYGLVLTAITYASNVSYIAAFRQLSIPLGAILGILVQKEPAYPPKLASIGIIFAGLVMIALA